MWGIIEGTINHFFITLIFCEKMWLSEKKNFGRGFLIELQICEGTTFLSNLVAIYKCLKYVKKCGYICWWLT